MRTPHLLRRQTLSVNMTPMIDVVFLLIIFFLVSSHLARQESQLPLSLPQAESGEEIDDRQPRVVVNVTTQGRILWGGQSLTPGELESRLAAKRAEVGAQLEVRIRSDRAVPFQVVQPILRAVSRSGIGKVTFAVTRRGA